MLLVQRVAELVELVTHLLHLLVGFLLSDRRVLLIFNFFRFFSFLSSVLEDLLVHVVTR